MNNFNDALVKRRSIYSISNKIDISKDRIIEIVEHAVKHTPSAFNSQSGRVVILFEKNHDKLWEIVRDSLKKIIDPANFETTSKKIDAFKAGYGTILYFEDQDVVSSLQEKFPIYSKDFPVWSIQSNAMIQSNIWTSLAVLEIGASLQHYNDLIEASVKEIFNLPSAWKMYAQMPFGNIVESTPAKEFSDIKSRVIVLD